MRLRRYGAQRARFLDDLFGAGACEHAEGAPSAFDAHHARAVELRRGRIAFEHQFDTAIGSAQVIEGAFENCASRSMMTT